MIKHVLFISSATLLLQHITFDALAIMNENPL